VSKNGFSSPASKGCGVLGREEEITSSISSSNVFLLVVCLGVAVAIEVDIFCEVGISSLPSSTLLLSELAMMNLFAPLCPCPLLLQVS